jgi:hypothetical protein
MNNVKEAGAAKKKDEIEKEKLRARVKACLHQWCNDTTLHGFVNIIKTDSIIIRLIWIVLVVVCLIYCFYSKLIYRLFIRYHNFLSCFKLIFKAVSDSISKFFSYDVTMDYQIIYENQMEFPGMF